MEERGPFGVSNFEIELDGRSVGFAEVRGLGVELDDTDDHASWRVKAVTLRRAVIGDLTLWKWVLRNRSDAKDLRTVRITLLDTRQSPVCSWTLRGARPIAWRGPTLDAAGAGDAATEELVIVAEDLEYAPAATRDGAS